VTKKRNVRFDLNSVVHVVRGRPQITPEQCEKIWFSRSDFAVIKARNNLIVRKYALDDRSEKPAVNNDCVRGLEHRLRGRRLQRKTVKTNALNAVLTEQARQSGWTKSDPDLIRMTYCEYNKKCADEAYERGLMDHREVRNNCDLPRRRNAFVLIDLDLSTFENLVLEEEASLEEAGSDSDSSMSIYGSMSVNRFGEDALDDLQDSILILEDEDIEERKCKKCILPRTSDDAGMSRPSSL
jgi:hypothetical protein